MTARILEIAEEARRAGVAAGLRRLPDLTLADLYRAIEASPYADDLRTITVAELLLAKTPSGRKRTRLRARAGEPLEDTMMRAFRASPQYRFSSSFFTRELVIRRWTAQKSLEALVAQGLVIRSGTTSSTRYRLNLDQAAEAPTEARDVHLGS